MEIQTWAEDLTAEVFRKWEDSANRYDFSASGFRVFGSPVFPCPDLMVIGHHPGHEDQPFTRKDACRIPVRHEYLYDDSKLAKKMKYLFEGIDRDDWLSLCIKVHLIFFFSESESQWESLKKEVRDDLEMFCFRKVNDIVDTVKPRYIVTEGLNVFDILTNSVLMGCDKPVVKIGVGGRKIYARSRYGHTHIIGLPNLAKNVISYPDWNDVKKYLKLDLKALEQMGFH